jgi:hypothetical protein
MRYLGHDIDDDRVFETVITPDGRRARILKDGARMVVRARMMDHRSVGDCDAGPARVTDSAGHTEFHKPGWRMIADDTAGMRAKEIAYRQADATTVNAYKPTQSEFGPDAIGQVCTVQGAEYPLDYGAPGHVKRVGGRIVCVPDRSRGDEDDESGERATSDHRTVAQMMRDHQNTMADIYAEIDHGLSEK